MYVFQGRGKSKVSVRKGLLPPALKYITKLKKFEQGMKSKRRIATVLFI